MTQRDLLDEVCRMRAMGASPRVIARTLGVRPAVVTPLLHHIAAETAEVPIEEAELVGCWVSPSWSRELLVQHRDGWSDVDLGPDGPAGIVLVLVARDAGRRRVSVYGYLVDTFCLGVKNVIVPEPMSRRELAPFVRAYFM